MFVCKGSDKGRQALGFLLNKWSCPFSDKGLQMELPPGFVLMALLQYTLIKTMSRCQQPTACLDPEPTWVMGFLLWCCQNGCSNIIYWLWETTFLNLCPFTSGKNNYTPWDWADIVFKIICLNCYFCAAIWRYWLIYIHWDSAYVIYTFP